MSRVAGLFNLLGLLAGPDSQLRTGTKSSLTNPLLESIRDGKCNVVETCVGDYIQQIRWKRVFAYDFTEEDEKTFNLELETARDADAGKITREQASDRLREISTDQLKRLYDLIES